MTQNSHISKTPAAQRAYPPEREIHTEAERE